MTGDYVCETIEATVSEQYAVLYPPCPPGSGKRTRDFTYGILSSTEYSTSALSTGIGRVCAGDRATLLSLYIITLTWNAMLMWVNGTKTNLF